MHIFCLEYQTVTFRAVRATFALSGKIDMWNSLATLQEFLETSIHWVHAKPNISTDSKQSRIYVHQALLKLF